MFRQIPSNYIPNAHNLKNLPSTNSNPASLISNPSKNPSTPIESPSHYPITSPIQRSSFHVAGAHLQRIMHSHLCGYSHRVAHAYQPPPLSSSLSLPSSSPPPLFSPRCLALPLKFQPGAGTGTLMSKRCWPGFSIFYSFHGVEAKHRPPLLRHHGSPPIFCYVYTAAHVRRPYCISGS